MISAGADSFPRLDVFNANHADLSRLSLRIPVSGVSCLC